MKKSYAKHSVLITNSKTGESRSSKPIPTNRLRQESGSKPLPATPEETADSSIPPSSSTSSESSQDGGTQPQISQEGPDKAAAPSTPAESNVLGPGPSEGGLTENGQDKSSARKSKPDIETLEQFIFYAYSRKGQQPVLKPKVKQLIAKNLTLDDSAMSRLFALASGDVLLAVPRQLLLLSRDIDGHPQLRAALGSFVLSVMEQSPTFAGQGIQGALRNLPDALSPREALAKVAAFSPAEKDGKGTLKGTELQALRRNAAHLLATWLTCNRGFNLDELSTLLSQVMWLPAALELTDDSARLRALTEIEQPAGVGLACRRLTQQANDANASLDQAFRDARHLRERLGESETMRVTAEQEREKLEAALQALRDETSAEMADLQRQREVERTHMRHDQEQLRGRLVRRLEEGVEMLDVGLTALRNKTPRIEVMVERAEHVADALRAEIHNLKEE